MKPRLGMLSFFLDVAEVKGYWERRFQSGPSLDTVGWLGFRPGVQSVDVSRTRADLSHAGPPRAAGLRHRAADGQGTGRRLRQRFYLDLWQRMGARRVFGCDLTLFPGVEVSQADIGDERVPFEPGSFDAISCMDVLFHIVDDARYERAIRTCASLLRPGGILLQFCWRVLNAVVRRYPALGSPAGMTLYPPELLLSSVLREGLSTEMMICRR